MVDMTKTPDTEPPLMHDHPLYRIGTQVHDHEVRIRMLERDYAEIKEIKQDVKALQLDVGSMKQSVAALPGQLGAMLNAALSQHEVVEAKQQSRIMWVLLSLTLAIIGSAAYLVVQHLLERFVK